MFGTIKQWLFNLLIGPQLGVWVRALLKVAAGFLVAKGVLTVEAQDAWIATNADVIIAVVMLIVAQASSLVAATDKK